VKLRVREYDDLPCVLMEPRGILDVPELVALRNAINRMVSRGRVHVIVSLREVRHLHYVGLTILSEAAARLRDFDGDVYISGANPYLSMIFRSVGLERSFRFLPSVREATALVRIRTARG
jgi:anti-anti-sigma factor